MSERRLLIREIDSRYVVPTDVEPVRVLAIMEGEPDGNVPETYRVYVCLCMEKP